MLRAILTTLPLAAIMFLSFFPVHGEIFVEVSECSSNGEPLSGADHATEFGKADCVELKPSRPNAQDKL